jgi:transposase InsO family protein
MDTLARLYRPYAARLSLKGFMRVMGQPYWQLRDYLRASAQRRQRATAHGRAGAWVHAVAAAEPTYGYRRVYEALRQQHRPIGRERVRQLMGELGLQPPPPMKKKRPAPTVTAERDWPPGRRLQIDATRFRLDDGVAWVYLVEDVKTRQCVAASAAPALSQERAAATLLEGHRRLIALRLAGPRLIQSDAGSDFTSSHFQHTCQTLGQWVRCRVAQVGGMGILERLNRTFKHEFVFRHEVNTLADLQALLPAFQRWYNEQRLHSHLAYRTPAAVLAEEVAILS